MSISTISAVISTLKDLVTRESELVEPGVMTIAERTAREAGLDLYDCTLFPTYGDGGWRGMTVAGGLAYRPAGKRAWDYDDIEDDVDYVLGGAHMAFGYKLHEGRERGEWRPRDYELVAKWLEERIPAIEAEVAAKEELVAQLRKDFGEGINKRFEARGADRATRDAWWKMQWKHEVQPEDFMDALYRALADREAFSLALECQSRSDLEALGWMCRPTVPRTQAMLHALGRATGIKKATIQEYNAWKIKLRRPGKWVFGE